MTLEIRDLTAFHGKVQALHGLSLRVEPAQVHALLGRNGAGKSAVLGRIALMAMQATIRSVTWAARRRFRSISRRERRQAAMQSATFFSISKT